MPLWLRFFSFSRSLSLLVVVKFGQVCLQLTHLHTQSKKLTFVGAGGSIISTFMQIKRRIRLLAGRSLIQSAKWSESERARVQIE